MKISKHLSLAEVIRSESAKRKGINNMPTAEHLENFKLLAEKVFEPIRAHFGVPIFISSGYRSAELNKAIGGAGKIVNGVYVPSSQHCKGEAIDIDMDGSDSEVTNKMVFDFIVDNLDWDQIIHEFGTDSNPDWVHVSYTKGKNRKQKLKAVRKNGKTSYINLP
jgi:zinc D-Ala-D-Ala carboxypeptidase